MVAVRLRGGGLHLTVPEGVDSISLHFWGLYCVGEDSTRVRFRFSSFHSFLSTVVVLDEQRLLARSPAQSTLSPGTFSVPTMSGGVVESSATSPPLRSPSNLVRHIPQPRLCRLEMLYLPRHASFCSIRSNWDVRGAGAALCNCVLSRFCLFPSSRLTCTSLVELVPRPFGISCATTHPIPCQAGSGQDEDDKHLPLGRTKLICHDQLRSFQGLLCAYRVGLARLHHHDRCLCFPWMLRAYLPHPARVCHQDRLPCFRWMHRPLHRDRLPPATTTIRRCRAGTFADFRHSTDIGAAWECDWASRQPLRRDGRSEYHVQSCAVPPPTLG